MDYLLDVLTQIKYEFFCKGIYTNGLFYELPDYFKLNAVKVQAKKGNEKKLLINFAPLYLIEISKNDYGRLFRCGKEYYLYIEYVVNSHILIPESLLKDFCSEDTRLYYLNTEMNKIVKGSASKFNTKIGYYSLRFERYLSDNFETKLGNIKRKVENFVFEKQENVKFVGLIDDMKRFLDMSFFRNPRFIEQINNESLSSKIKYNGYSSEDVAFFKSQFGSYIMNGRSVYLVENRTCEGFLLSGEIFSNIIIKGGIEGLIFPLHPKYGFIIVPNDYYESQNKIYSNHCYMIVGDLETLHNINNRIYSDCKRIGANVIGRKSDLENVLLLQ